jgi:hypothetical protein
MYLYPSAPPQILETLAQLLTSNLVPFAESECSTMIDPKDGLLYDSLDVILSAGEHFPREIAEDCLPQLDVLAAVIMSKHRHAEVQELAADLINRTRPPAKALLLVTARVVCRPARCSPLCSCGHP